MLYSCIADLGEVCILLNYKTLLGRWVLLIGMFLEKCYCKKNYATELPKVEIKRSVGVGTAVAFLN